ncbi:unnamed protein product, partial [Prorocentrum cordatum]
DPPEGISQIARMLRLRRDISSRTAVPLLRVDVAFQVARHMHAQKADFTFNSVMMEVTASLDRPLGSLSLKAENFTDARICTICSEENECQTDMKMRHFEAATDMSCIERTIDDEDAHDYQTHLLPFLAAHGRVHESCAEA